MSVIKKIMGIVVFCGCGVSVMAQTQTAISHYSVETVYEQGDLYYSKKTRKPITGQFQAFYPNGKIYQDITFVNGLENGVAIAYNIDGGIETKEVYKDGKLNGECFYYYPSGKINTSVQFKNGKEDGLSIEYYESGDVKVENMYTGDYLLRITYTEDGELEGEAEFYKNKPRAVKIYSPLGFLALEETYNDNGVIKRIYYDEKGNKKHVSSIKSDK